MNYGRLGRDYVLALREQLHEGAQHDYRPRKGGACMQERMRATGDLPEGADGPEILIGEGFVHVKEQEQSDQEPCPEDGSDGSGIRDQERGA
jgi:hypothetical protein